MVTHRSYFETLSVEELGNIRNNVLKSHFRDANIDREGGFLKFFDKHLYKLIGTPYRESLHTIIKVSPTVNQTQWQVKEQTRYTCRMVCGTIQPSVPWVSDREELEMLSLKVDVIYPGGSTNEGKREQIADFGKDNFGNDQNKLDLSLAKFKDEDGLIVQLDAIYHVDKEKFQTWQMVVPTKKFDIEIWYPIDSIIQCEIMILDSSLIATRRDNGWLSIASDAWILPESGLVWRVFDKIEHE